MIQSWEYDNEEDEAPELAGWVEWPQCPLCAQRRQARCATCGFASDDFPLADYQEAGLAARALPQYGDSPLADAPSSDAVLLMCPACEEAFRPGFYERCAACGYEYGDGVRADNLFFDDFSPRAAWAIAGLLGLTLALFAYYGAVLAK